ncbi:hypothetical protein FYJ63_03950 [Mobiluncus holmesii]|uniref:Uncharacterized protein n=1 Tax=Mobiluncus porci TaxID=2652278 RepID=A0A7K0K2Y0_9ACTO|nr:hypothetical protein [Mobiluncus porci]
MYPFPGGGNGEGLFVRGDRWEGLGFLEFTGLDELLAFDGNLRKQILSGAVLGALLGEVTGDTGLQDGLFQVSKEGRI